MGGKGPTFREIARERQIHKKLRLAPASHETDQLRLKTLLAEFGRRPVCEITPADIDEFLAKLVEDGRTTATANRYLSLLSSIFSLAVRNGRIESNPCKRVQRFKENPGRVRFLSEQEEAALRAAIQRLCPDRESELDLALHTGLRRGEQFGLRRDGVDLDRSVLTVHGKTGRRYVPINSVARAALEKLLASHDGEFVCRDKASGRRDWRRWFERCVRSAGIGDFHWHDLRHTFASRLVMDGVDIRSVQELLGHKSIIMTTRYAHLSPAHQHANVERLARRVAPPEK
jgi:site-specific recombinase XerD